MAQYKHLKWKPTGLSAAAVRSIAEPGKYHDGKGTGLILYLKPNGSQFWVQRIYVRGRRREIGLGSPPLVTLAEARDKAAANKRHVIAGRDPLAEKRKATGHWTKGCD